MINKPDEDPKPIHRYYLGDYYDDEWMDKGTQTVINGSRRTRHELEARMAWWTNRPIERVFAPPLDENHVPMHLCGHCGQYVKRNGFRKDAGRKSGLDSMCKDCRHEQYLHIKSTRVA